MSSPLDKLKKLTRYDCPATEYYDAYYGNCGKAEPWDDGDYVRYDDVIKLLEEIINETR